jgi:MFS transporter, SP family, xylose:H+ symportor
MRVIIRHLLAHRRVLKMSSIASLGGYLFGFHFGVITAMLPFLRTEFELNALSEGLLTGSLALGCIVGSLLAGKIADTNGRRPAISISAIIFATAALGMAVAPNLNWLIMMRFLAGIGVGMASILCPLYLAEIAPAAIRGRMVALYQLMIVLGILGASLSNYGLSGEGAEAWRWMIGLGIIPAVLLIIGVPLLPESPRWLMLQGKNEMATKILKYIGDEDLEKETNEAKIKTSIAQVSLSELFSPSLRPVLMLGMTLAVFQQFCGINVVFNYTSTIFASVGANLNRQLLETVLISLVNFIFTLIAIWQVDRLGRKGLLLIGALGLAIDYVVLALLLQYHAHPNWISLFVIIAIGLYASSLAPVTWILISEIFPNHIRGRASALAVVTLWMAYFVLVFTFPLLSQLFGVFGPFYVYAGICLIGSGFILIAVKETKGKTLEAIEQQHTAR